MGESMWLRMLRQEALIQQNGKCIYCSAPLSHADATAEHCRPRSRGGPTTRSNIKAACAPCNTARGDIRQGQFFKLITNKRPPRGVSTQILMIWASRRIWQRTWLAVRRIKNASSVPELVQVSECCDDQT